MNLNHFAIKLYNVSTYGIAAAGIAVNFDSIKSVILFIGALILLALQIKLHLIKIKKEKQNKE